MSAVKIAVNPTVEEMQYAVGEWHVVTFGEGDFATRIARKLGEEVAELNQALGALGITDRDDEGHPEVMCEMVQPELADVAVGVMALAHRLGVDLDFVVTKKLKELWMRTASGDYASGKRW